MKMEKLAYVCCLLVVVGLASCNSENSKPKAKEPEGVVTQAVTGDTVVTHYYGVSPYKFHQQVKTQVEFVRNINDTTGRFFMTEVYLNREDSVVQRYDGAGNYKIIPKPSGEIQGVALYNMVLDDNTKGYMYLLKDSVTMIKVDERGNEIKGADAVTLKSTDRKYM
jgi:hypothetical protein